MKRLVPIFVSLILAAGCTTRVAPTSDASRPSASGNRQNEWRIPGTDSFIIHSSLARADFEVTVAVPRGYSESSGKYPVLYVLDANWAFPIAVEAARLLAIGPKDNPTGDLKEQPLIVGIGYPVGLYWNAISARLKDFTPTSDPVFVHEIANAVGFAPEASGSGGAAAFLEFLAKEMMPTVETRYRIDDRRRALFGHSLGGLFAAYVLFHQPDLFDSYLVTSPALYWDHESIWKFEQEFSQGHKNLPVRVFLTGGSLDEQHTAMVRKLDDVFRSRKYGRRVWHTEVFSGETHSSVGAVSLTRGIRWLYGDLTPKS
jgi:predicted alpha/beta superfamily hydrolase